MIWGIGSLPDNILKINVTHDTITLGCFEAKMMKVMTCSPVNESDVSSANAVTVQLDPKR